MTPFCTENDVCNKIFLDIVLSFALWLLGLVMLLNFGTNFTIPLGVHIIVSVRIRGYEMLVFRKIL